MARWDNVFWQSRKTRSNVARDRTAQCRRQQPFKADLPLCMGKYVPNEGLHVPVTKAASQRQGLLLICLSGVGDLNPSWVWSWAGVRSYCHSQTLLLGCPASGSSVCCWKSAVHWFSVPCLSCCRRPSCRTELENEQLLGLLEICVPQDPPQLLETPGRCQKRTHTNGKYPLICLSSKTAHTCYQLVSICVMLFVLCWSYVVKQDTGLLKIKKSFSSL